MSERISEPRDTRPAAGSASLSIVVPAYNEAARIGGTLEQLRNHFEANDHPVEIIVVDDGSTDDTAGVVRAFEPGRLTVRLLANNTRSGKGAAVRKGMLAATGDLLLMYDADAPAPPDQIDRLRAAIDAGADIAIGSRDVPGAQLDPPQPWPRRVLAWTFRTIRRTLLLPNLQDTQCGCKLFRRDVAQTVFSELVETGWLFDCEILARAARRGYRITEVGITWRNHPDSRVNVWRELFTTLPALLRIWRRVM